MVSVWAFWSRSGLGVGGLSVGTVFDCLFLGTLGFRVGLSREKSVRTCFDTYQVAMVFGWWCATGFCWRV